MTGKYYKLKITIIIKTEKVIPAQKSISTCPTSNRLTRPVIVTTSIPNEMRIAIRNVFNISLTYQVYSLINCIMSVVGLAIAKTQPCQIVTREK
jgi:hypothetical protein